MIEAGRRRIASAVVAVVGVAVVGLAACSSGSPAPNPTNAGIDAALARDARKAGFDLPRSSNTIVAQVIRLLALKTPPRITIQYNDAAAISETGVGGFTDPRTGQVTISVATAPPHGLKRALRTWLPAALAHELDHTKRILEGPGYGTTLGEAITSEGLADAFDMTAFPNTPTQPWDHALTSSQLTQLTATAARDWDTTETLEQHRRWFFGAGPTPRWAGYSIAYALVTHYLQTHPKSSTAAATTNLIARDLRPDTTP